MQNCLQAQLAHDYITPDEYAQGMKVLQHPSTIGEPFTIGYELEVTRSALADITYENINKIFADKKTSKNFKRSAYYDAIAFECHSLGYGSDREEAYEVSSPPSTHPAALRIAHMGIVRSRLIPSATNKMITQHTSVGVVPNEAGVPFGTPDKYVRLLRVVEVLGASTAKRICEPVVLASAKNPARDCVGDEKDSTSWSYLMRGYAGFANRDMDETNSKKIGDNHRLEFRSLQYRAPEEMYLGLDALYYICMGIATFGTTQRDIHTKFDNAVQDIFIANSLPMYYPGYSVCADPKQYKQYIDPFARLFSNTTAIRALYGITREAVLAMREESGFTDILSSFDKPALDL